MLGSSKIFVLCGGEGRRLKEISGDIPKPLVSVFGVPFLKYQIDKWYAEGFRHYHFLLCYKSRDFVNFFDEYLNNFNDINFTYSIEKAPLDTGGAVKAALLDSQMEDEYCTVVNADTFVEFNIKPILRRRRNQIGLVQSSEYQRFGQVTLSETGLVLSMAEKSDKKLDASLINCGIYYLNSNDVVDFNMTKFSLEKDFLPHLIHLKLLYGEIFFGKMIDIGTPKSFIHFRDNFNEII